MKLVPFCSLLLAGTSVAYGANNAAVYELSGEGSISAESIQLVSMNSAILYLADKFGLGEYYTVGEKPETVETIDSLHKEQSSKPSLLVMLKGVDVPSSLVADINPSFEIQLAKRKSAKHLVKNLFKVFPKQFAKSVNASGVSHLTGEIKYVLKDDSKLTQDFKHFHHELPKRWNSIVDTFNSKQDAFANLDSSLQLVNDKLYINELMQLLKLSPKSTEYNEDQAVLTSSSFVVANMDSLYSLGSKLGYDARTYQVAKASLIDSIVALQAVFDVTIVALGPEHKHACHKEQLSKRSKELNQVFSEYSKRSTSSASTCFSDESECETATNSCNNHGACTNVGSKCWQCLCSPSVDKKTSKTTKWAGYDCSKKDIASQTQLLLWTSIGLLVTLVGSIKLLFSIGGDSLPGVLEAATLKKSA